MPAVYAPTSESQFAAALRSDVQLRERPPPLQQALFEASAIQHCASPNWRGFATVNSRRLGEELRQDVFSVDNLPLVLRALMRGRLDRDLYVSQHSYSRRHRRTVDLLTLNCGHIDLDIYKHDSWRGLPIDDVVHAVLRRLDQHGIPLPSYVVHSGRGLQVKWLWSEPLSPKALIRWQVAHRFLVNQVLPDFQADITAILPTQLMRILGSINQKNGAEVQMAWCNGPLHSPQRIPFETWAAAVLPYSRAQVKAFRALTAKFDGWREENTSNAAKRAETRSAASARARQQRQAAWTQVSKAIGLELQPEALASMDDLVAGEIWQRRLGVMQRLAQIRFGGGQVPEGSHQRNSWIWLAANALAWVNRGQAEPLREDILGWADQHVPSLPMAEVLGSAATVLRRAREVQGQDTGLYRMSEGAFRRELEVTEAELQQLGATPSKAWAGGRNSGAMGLEPMRGLSFEDYQAETRRRQAAGARYSARTRQGGHGQDKRASALLLRAQGLSQAAIAAKIGVPPKTVSNWLK